jgi:hypothetical protein
MSASLTRRGHESCVTGALARNIVKLPAAPGYRASDSLLAFLDSI